MKKLSIFFVVISVLFASCSEYQKILKSDDAQLKYTKAIEYFNVKDYVRAATLLEDISSYYKGTDRSESVLMYLAKSYLGQKDYLTASEYFKTYVKSFPKGPNAVEAKYMIGYCYYLDSPDARLDQSSTYTAITAYQEFLDMYPESERVQEATKQLEELTNKLAYKELLNARLYYNLGNYMGNNYESAMITAQNALKKYPSNAYREDLMMVILQSRFEMANMSLAERQADRFRSTIDEYYSFINEYPTGKYRKEADHIFNESKKNVKE